MKGIKDPQSMSSSLRQNGVCYLIPDPVWSHPAYVTWLWKSPLPVEDWQPEEMNLDDEAIGRFSIKAWLSTLSDKKSESFYFA
jgi:hypothetical protein